MPQPRKSHVPELGLKEFDLSEVVEIAEGAVKVRALNHGEVKALVAEVASQSDDQSVASSNMEMQTAMVAAGAVEPKLSAEEVSGLLQQSVVKLSDAISGLSGLESDDAESEEAAVKRFPAG